MELATRSEQGACARSVRTAAAFGETSSFEALLEPVLGRAYAAALGMSGNPSDAEDLVQEAALRAFRAFGTFTPGTNFKAWFLCILTNVFRACRRKEKWLNGSVSFSEVADDAVHGRRHPDATPHAPRDPGSELISRLDTDHVLTALHQLPDPFRTVSVLYFVDEFTYQEIADMLGCSLGTIRSRIHRGRRLLQKALRTFAQESAQLLHAGNHSTSKVVSGVQAG